MSDREIVRDDAKAGLAAERGWSDLADRAVIEQEPVRARGLLYGVAVVVVILVTWSSFAEIDEVTRGDGKVIPSSQLQVIGSQDGGVITDILVRPGDLVRRGDTLFRLDSTRSLATLGGNQAELRGLRVKALRLNALVSGEAFQPSEEMLLGAADVVAVEQQLYDSTKLEFEAQKQIAEQQLVQRLEELDELKIKSAHLERERDLAGQELQLARPMVSSGAVSQVELLRLERELNRAAGELEQTLAQIKRLESAVVEARERLSSVALEFDNDMRKELSEALSRIEALRELSEGLSDRVRQTNLIAPVDGTVNRLFYNTLGGVVLPGRDVIEMVPSDDTLLLAARIKPKDIAFIAPGQAASVKVTAYDFVVYGNLSGKVETIGADTVVDEKGEAHYEVTVRTLQADFGPDKPIIPGMTVEVDIITGKKTVLNYLARPILRASQKALTER